jgi:hypothetical protein
LATFILLWTINFTSILFADRKTERQRLPFSFSGISLLWASSPTLIAQSWRKNQVFEHIANGLVDCSFIIMGSDQVVMLPSALMSFCTGIETFRRIIQQSSLDSKTKSELDHRFLLFISDLEVTAQNLSDF